MKSSHFLATLLLFCSTASGAAAQSLKNWSDFTAQGYRLDQRGYPGAMVADPSGQLLYTEWSAAGQNGRRHAAHYLQSVSPTRYEENWFRALNKAGEPPFTPIRLIRLAETVAVVGRVPDPATKGENIVVRFFSFTGPERGNGFVLQRLARQPGDFVVHLAADPAGRRMLYYGVDRGLSIRQREHFCAVVAADGQIQWSRALELQTAGIGAKNPDKYAVLPPVIDAAGAVSFLTVPVVYGGTLDDIGMPARLLRYDPRTKLLGETAVRFGYTFCEAALQQLSSGELVVLALVVDGQSPTRFWNGKTPARGGDGKGKHWGRLGYLRLGPDGKVRSKKLWPLPDSIGLPYQQLGPNLTEGRLLYAGATPAEPAPAGSTDLYWLWEEAYRADAGRGTPTRGELAIFALDTGADSLRLGRRLSKRQRDSRGDLTLGAAAGLTPQWLRLVYTDEVGGELRLRVSSLNRQQGGLVHKDLLERANDYAFFPSRSCQVDASRLYLLGAGRLGENYYRLMQLLLD